MNSGILQVFQRELTCPICMNYFIDPVTIDCGHTFCRPCFYLNWQDIALLAQCSECRKITQQKNLKTDIHVKKMASLAKKASLWQFLSSEEQMCGTHREIKKMFCDVVKSLLCLLCSSSQEHRDHRHCPIEWAEKLLKEMQSLWEKACENHRNLNVETTRTRCWKDYVSLRIEEIRTEFQKMPAFLHDEEQHHLERLQKEGEDIFQQLNDSKEILTGMYADLKQICHKADVELLQVWTDHGSLLLQVLQPVNPELSAGPITGLLDRLNGFRVDITLHHEKTNSRIFLYGDLRSMNVGCDPQNDPHITATPGCFLTFTSGKYYWEVHVADSWNWAFGEGLFLLGCVKEDVHCSLFTTSPLMVLYVPRPTRQVGVFLDCEGRTMRFVDVGQSSLIYTIPNCSFSPPLRPVFCCSHFRPETSQKCVYMLWEPVYARKFPFLHLIKQDK
uniref:Tripartite motif-containing protein 5 n=1 Tax=Macaca nemestrina TaxID=9545 RepID=A0A2K6E5G6_MACNE